jgi:hypothetical protein
MGYESAGPGKARPTLDGARARPGPQQRLALQARAISKGRASEVPKIRARLTSQRAAGRGRPALRYAGFRTPPSRRALVTHQIITHSETRPAIRTLAKDGRYT